MTTDQTTTDWSAPPEVAEFFASSIPTDLLHRLLEHARQMVADYPLSTELAMIAAGIDRALNEEPTILPAGAMPPRCPRCGASRHLHPRWDICQPCVLTEGWGGQDNPDGDPR